VKIILSANVEFNITAFDEASSVFSRVSSNATQCFTGVETGASEQPTPLAHRQARLSHQLKPLLLA
jgi:hypothetical protein